MAQGYTQQILNAFRTVPREDLAVLEEELALTGCLGQEYVREKALPPVLPTGGSRRNTILDIQEDEGTRFQEGPAILVYYAPAFMSKASKTDPASGLTILADIFRQARSLFPSSAARAGDSVIVRIDMLKDLDIRTIRESNTAGEVWVLGKTSNKDAQVRRVNLVKHHKDGLNWSTSRVLFGEVPKAPGRSRYWGMVKNAAKKATSWNTVTGTAVARPASSSPRSRTDVRRCFSEKPETQGVPTSRLSMSPVRSSPPDSAAGAPPGSGSSPPGPAGAATPPSSELGPLPAEERRLGGRRASCAL